MPDTKSVTSEVLRWRIENGGGWKGRLDLGSDGAFDGFLDGESWVGQKLSVAHLQRPDGEDDGLKAVANVRLAARVGVWSGVGSKVGSRSD